MIAVNKPLVYEKVGRFEGSLYPNKFFNVVLFTSLTGFFLTFFIFYTSNQINLDIGSIGQTYAEGYKDYEKNSGSYSLSFILYSLLSTPNFFVAIWGIYFFPHIENYKKVAVLTCAFGAPALFTLSAGTQKNIGDVFMYLSAIIFIKIAVNRDRKFIINIIKIFSLSVFGAFALTFILGQRYSAISVDAFNINEREISLLSYDLDNVIFHIFGPDIGFTLAILSGYLTNGYNGLSYALHTQSTWSFMLGSSYSMSVIGERVFGLPSGYLNSYPYLTAIESGWGETRWYSVFSWFASDFTFAGTIPLFGFFAYVYGRAWMESIRFQNPFSIAIFCLLTLGAFMMPANNQLMQTPGGLLTLGATVFCYLRFRKRYNISRNVSGNTQ